MAVIGIDLGTTNSLAALWQDNKVTLIPNALGDYLTPSVVGLDDDGALLVGKVAQERLISHPHLTASCFKRRMGTTGKIALGEQQFSPEELSSMVLRKIREDAEQYLQQPITEAIISVPAYFNDNQRSATKAAAQLAGLYIERLVNEPSAAALAARMSNTGEDQTFLVFDLGGGTLDVSVVDCFDNVIEIIAVAGDNHLGGEDFDNLLVDYFCRQNQLVYSTLSPATKAILQSNAELCKQQLSEQQQVHMFLRLEDQTYSILLTQELLAEIFMPLLKRTEKVIQRALADSNFSSIDDVLMVGGSSKMPIVRGYVNRLFSKAPTLTRSPDVIIAEGAGIYAGIKSRNGEIRDIMMTDVCPFSLGIGAKNDRSDLRAHVAMMIERNSLLPSSISKYFTTLHDGQTSLNISIYQGEEFYADENICLGELNMPLPSAPAGVEGVEVRFSYDINGILQVEVSHEKTQVRKQVVIIGEYNTLTEEDIQQKLAELEKIKLHPAQDEQNRLLSAWGERLYTESLGEVRENIVRCLGYFNQALNSQRPHRIRQARKKVTDYFEQLTQQHFIGNRQPSDFMPDTDQGDEE
ncbi:Hsp70 family protein [Chania multitudinisentens]|uniref:Hsp70 family protein n=1 Tax=Chania multitudinisentens TaxID=1639108 RepID=UPI0003E12F54|nr:Hsp70 family protein [Chania multitudinisentens]